MIQLRQNRETKKRHFKIVIIHIYKIVNKQKQKKKELKVQFLPRLKSWGILT